MKACPAFIRHLLSAILIGLLAACAQTPEITPKPPEKTPQQITRIQQADKLAASGDFTAAAAAYQEIAAGLPPPLSDDYRVKAADAWVKAGEFPRAKAALARVVRDRLTPIFRQLARLVEAEVLLASGDPESALDMLRDPAPGAAAGQMRIRWIETRARAQAGIGNALEAARSLSELDPLLLDRTRRLENQARLLQLLSRVPEPSLRALRPTPPGVFGGWMDLAASLHSSQPELAIDAWRATHPGHPVLPQLLNSYRQTADADLMSYGRIAVLLPSSGRYAQAGTALRAGLMATYYAAAPEQRPPISFYDTSDSSQIWPIYQQAVSEGAGAIIGPLQKTAVEQLARAGELAVPVLAMNRVDLDTAPPAKLYQYSLSPEDEAAQAAEKAWRDGAMTALALVPDNDWGARMLDSFTERFQALGGQVAEQGSYDPAGNDFSESIEALLNLDDSNARYKSLIETLGRRFEFEPAGRADAGALFLAANAAKARQIWPQLQFNRIGGIPVYTTSDIYGGRFVTPRDLDLLGLTFSDIPWLLAPEGRAPVSPDAAPQGIPTQGALARLFAMGMDSYRLLGASARLGAFPGTSLPGATGDLRLDELRRVQRTLLWARMENEGPRVLGFTPDGKTQDWMPVPQSPAAADASAR